jgi:hypothetical protein
MAKFNLTATVNTSLAGTTLAGEQGFTVGVLNGVGATGPAGATGETGAAGAAATIAVGTVITGAAGSSASVTNSGTSSAATFDFSIPKGDTGDTGPTGADGGRNIPQNTDTGTVTLDINDAGDHISISSPTGTGVTVPANVFAVGDVVTVYNNSTSNLTITEGANVTLRQAGTANEGDRTLAQYGVCSIMCVADVTDADVFVIAGAGLS